MRILIVNYEFPPIGAGGGQASQKIAECLVEMGHSVRVITSRPTQLYTLMGTISLLLGIGFWVYLAYAKLVWGEDISDRSWVHHPGHTALTHWLHSAGYRSDMGVDYAHPGSEAG
jgi:hypothetical protein